MNPLAEELNAHLGGSVIGDILSDFGKRLYFPRGVVAQTAEANSHASRFNATVGMAYHRRAPLYLKSIRDTIDALSEEEIFSYAPTAGVPELRDRWMTEMGHKNPDLDRALVSQPIVTSGLTGGIHLVADLFVDRGDEVLLPDMHWGNYRLIFSERREANVSTFPFFDASGGLDLAGFESALNRLRAARKVVLLLNFPNNPTGYAPSHSEAKQMIASITRFAQSGAKILVVCDDAYFGLFYEDDTYRQSLFVPLSTADDNLLAIKVDGATKEEFAWGFRIGFLTFGVRGATEGHYDALIKKTMGAVRSSVSNSSRIAQSLIVRAMNDPSYETEKQKNYRVMRERYQQVRLVLAERMDSVVPLRILPFNSGYFMTFEVAGGRAEQLRRNLLHDRGVGTISIGDRYLRVAFSTVETGDIADLYAEIYSAAADLDR